MLNTQEECSKSPGFTSSTPLKKVSEMENQFSFTELKMRQLDELIGKLEISLSPVLRVISPSEANKGEKRKEIEPLTPLAEKIKQIGDTIDIFGKRIRNILERLEL